MKFETDGRTDGSRMSEPDPRAVLDDLANRRRRCTAAIVNLASFYLLDPAPWLVDEGHGQAVSRNRESVANLTPQRAKRPKEKRDRPPDAPSAQGDRILTALKAHGSPMSPGELATKLKVDRQLIRFYVKKLEKQGLVTATGVTSGRRIALI